MQVWSFDGETWREGDLEGSALRWIDVVGPDRAEMDALAARFGLHHLAIDDCVSLLPHAPKIDEFDDHLFIVFHAFVQHDDQVETEELNAFLGRDFLITYRDRELPIMPLVYRLIAENRIFRPGADGLLYEILDRVVDEALPLVNNLGTRMDEMQEAAVDPRVRLSNSQVLAIRASAGKLRRLLNPQLNVIQRLSRGEFDQVAESNRMYFRDIYDHLVRIDFALEELREDAEVALNSYLNVVNNRLSEVMKVLSVVAVLSLPATVITGIFGTNFDDIPGLHSNWGFAAMLGAMAALSGSMIVFFKRRGWF
ncbi:MAG TPA: magnesium/cobalt transporter CorA [Tepidiformaceae bacterium]|nr:magnesium/cobalt transporter CorA [Tepidiformaceae bacterium]